MDNQSGNSRCGNNAVPLNQWNQTNNNNRCSTSKEMNSDNHNNQPSVPLSNWEECGDIDSGNQPVVPLPDWEECGDVDSGNQPAVPLPDWGECGNIDSDNQPAVPLPDWGEGGAVDSGMITLPCMRFCRIRFLNATEGYGAFRISIGSRLVTNALSYACMTPYGNVAEGFRIVTITSAASPRTVLFQREIPFNAGELITLAIIKAPQGLDVLRISDAYSLNNPDNRGGIRMANLVFNSLPLDLFLTNGRAVFSDVRYKEVTLFKQARPRVYNFYLAETPYYIESRYDDIEVIEDMPIMLQYGNYEAIARFSLDIKANTMYTIYVLGNWPEPILIKVVDNR